MKEWTDEHSEKLKAYLSREGYKIPTGLGTEDKACSIAAINLAYTGNLTDEIPGCMSYVIGTWILVIQDAMPASIRNSAGWRALLPKAAGTGRKKEKERLAIVMTSAWETLVPMLQPTADKRGFGVEWKDMCKNRNSDSARKVCTFICNIPTFGSKVSRAEFVANLANAAASLSEGFYNSIGATDLADASEAARSVAEIAELCARKKSEWKAIDPVGTLSKLIHLQPEG